jgi:hypothetical protein
MVYKIQDRLERAADKKFLTYSELNQFIRLCWQEKGGAALQDAFFAQCKGWSTEEECCAQDKRSAEFVKATLATAMKKTTRKVAK